jgi:hypothetical protein
MQEAWTEDKAASIGKKGMLDQIREHIIAGKRGSSKREGMIEMRTGLSPEFLQFRRFQISD